MSKPKTLSIDIETYSSVDIGKCGVYKYAESPDFGILLFAYSLDYGEVQLVDMAQGETIPLDIYEYIWDEDVEKTAFNANFERTCIGKYFDRYCPPEQWSCTMILAASCGLPMSLKNVGEALHLPADKAKMKEGADLIRYFCGPCKPTKTNGMRTRNLPEHAPEKWDTFCRYNIRDVETENTIRQMLLPWRPDYSEHKFWCLDQHINDSGVRIEPKLAENAIVISNDYTSRLLDEAAEISGLDNPNSTTQIKAWLEEQEDIEVESLNKKAVGSVIENLTSEKTKRFMELRQEFSQSTIKKYEAFLRCACEDNHIRGMFQFGGTSTGRFAGRLCQLQNLSHDSLDCLDGARQLVIENAAEDFECLYPNVQSALKAMVRTVLIPEEGHRFIVADFSAIEARVLAWLAGEQWRIDAFRAGKDIYCESASKAFKVPVVKHGINGHLRAKGKVLELACIAEGQLVLTDKGLVPIELVDEAMLLWDGEGWVNHGGVVYRGHKEVIEYEGLIATEDHVVWVEGQRDPVELGFAAKNNFRLFQPMAWRREIGEAVHLGKRRVYDILNAGEHNRFTVSGKLVHNCGYGGAIGALKNFGADELMSEEEMKECVALWREASPHIVAFWKSLEDAAIRCVAKGISTISSVGNIRFDMEDKFLWMRLPSGRRMAYYEPEITKGRFGGRAISYMTTNQVTRKWERIETFSSRLVENLTQATARDVLKEAMLNLADHGYDIRATVHDEVIVTDPYGHGTLEEVIQLMCKGAPWMEGLPLNADGYECTSYRKD